MWKDFLYFSKGERRAIIALIIVILFLQAALWTTDYWIPMLPESLTKVSVFRKELNAFQDTMSGQFEKGRYNDSSYKNSGSKYTGSVNSVRLTAFNPNTADSATLVSLGLRPYIAGNILKYRRKGGVFRNAEAVSHIYGLDPAQYARLKPFIRIDSEKQDIAGNAGSVALKEYDPLMAEPETERGSFSLGHSGQSVQGTSIEKISMEDASGVKSSVFASMDVNQVDTVVLQQLKGVGPVTANRIARYRSQLGGFYSIRQLEDIKGIYPDALARLQSFLKVDTAQIVKINANKASLERLKAHPYISFYQARVIVELRKARSGIGNIGELAAFKEFTKEDIDRLRWYLAF